MAADDKIFIPDNEDNKHIYDAIATVYRQQEARFASDPEFAERVREIGRKKQEG